jgi:D-sedoheptulose 7-phosphate isomerase
MHSNKMSAEKFLKDYLSDFSNLVHPSGDIISDLIQVRDAILSTNKNGCKIIIVGNGGSASMASHFSVDLTKNAGIRSVNFNEADLITCFANDYGFEQWVAKAVEFYGDDGDVLLAISSSGSSENMLNGCKAARGQNFSSVITFSGFDAVNPLRQLGNINLWVDSKAYNFVENIHQIWLLAVVDLIIGSREYSS